jgi:glycosyltransferase involved in cell wall biosynthesis
MSRNESLLTGRCDGPDSPSKQQDRKQRCSKVVLFANTGWYLYNFRLSLALELKKRGADVLLISPPGPYCDRFASFGLRWRALPFDRRTLNPFAQARTVAGLARIYRAEKPDVVHHFTIKCAVYGSVAARWAGVPVIVNALAGLGSAGGHTPSAGHRMARVLAFGSLKCALRNTHVIVQNPDDRDFLIRQKIVDAAACQLIRGSGVDLARFQPTRKATSGITVLLASRLLWSKGIAEFVQAAEAVRARNPHVRFAIAGDVDPGNPETLLPPDIKHLERNPHIVFKGHVDDMASLLAETDAVVLPTSYGEGVPRILVEAAACGLPLIATDAPGCREIVRPGANGCLVPAHDVNALVAAIERLADDSGLRAAMGSESRRIAETEFGENIVLGATIRAYRLNAPERALEWATSPASKPAFLEATLKSAQRDVA